MNRIRDIIGVVASKEYQQFRVAKCNRGVSPRAYLYSPTGRLPAFSFVSSANAIVQEVYVIRVFDNYREELIGILNIPLFERITIGDEVARFIHTTQQFPSLDEGNYYLKIVLESSNENTVPNKELYTELFEVASCCLDRIEWTDSCQIDASGLGNLYDQISWINTLYFPSCYVETDAIVDKVIKKGVRGNILATHVVREYAKTGFVHIYDRSISVIQSISASQKVSYISSNGYGFELSERDMNVDVERHSVNECVKKVRFTMLKGRILDASSCCHPPSENLVDYGIPLDEYKPCDWKCVKVSNLTAGYGSKGFILSWMGSSVHGTYQVYLHDNEGTEPTLLETTQLSYFGYELESCKDYLFSVRGVCLDGTLSESEFISYSTQGKPCGGMVEKLAEVANVTVDTITLSLLGEGNVTGYLVEWISATDINGFASSQVQSESINALASYTIAGLNSSNRYVVRVKAICSEACVSESEWQDYFAITSPCELDVEILKTNADCEIGNGSISISVTGSVGTTTVHVYRSNDNELIRIYEGEGDFHAIEGLRADTHLAIISDGVCTRQEYISVYDDCRCEIPEDLRVVTGDNGTALTWNGKMQSATVFYQKAGEVSWHRHNVTATNYSIGQKIIGVLGTGALLEEDNIALIEGLEEGDLYRFKVENKCGNVTTSNVSDPEVIEHCGCCPNCGDSSGGGGSGGGSGSGECSDCPPNDCTDCEDCEDCEDCPEQCVLIIPTPTIEEESDCVIFPNPLIEIDSQCGEVIISTPAVEEDSDCEDLILPTPFFEVDSECDVLIIPTPVTEEDSDCESLIPPSPQVFSEINCESITLPSPEIINETQANCEDDTYIRLQIL